LLIKFKEEESKTMSQVLLIAYKIQRGNQNKSLLSLDDNTSDRKAKQALSSLDGLQHFTQDRQNNVFSQVWMAYNISDRKTKQSLTSLDAFQLFRQKSKTNLSQVLMPHNISDRRERESDHTLAMDLQKENKKTLHIARRACKQRERRRVIREKWSEEGDLQEGLANREK
jgi:hypothetical protein